MCIEYVSEDSFDVIVWWGESDLILLVLKVALKKVESKVSFFLLFQTAR